MLFALVAMTREDTFVGRRLARRQARYSLSLDELIAFGGGLKGDGNRQFDLPASDGDWASLIQARRRHIARFLTWAAGRESVDSMRLTNRGDLRRVRAVQDLFEEPWWGAVVYTCFDSEVGTRAVAPLFRTPIDPYEAERSFEKIKLPAGSVQHHRTQPGHTGARIALVSACALADDFEYILREGDGFHGRYEALRQLKAKQWGRTTCFDLLVRAGQLSLGSGHPYSPDRAYLADSTGPRKGFEMLWGIRVTRANAAKCEELLRDWTARWQQVAQRVGVAWAGAPYEPGDFENALCIFQEERPAEC